MFASVNTNVEKSLKELSERIKDIIDLFIDEFIKTVFRKNFQLKFQQVKILIKFETFESRPVLVTRKPEAISKGKKLFKFVIFERYYSN